jgi:AhpD family alkylhydroperoxidase
MRTSIALAILLGPCRLLHSAEPEVPKPPPTRPAMKQAIEDQKKVKPRLPLPPLTDEEKARTGGRRLVNNGRMRAFYLPEELRGGNLPRSADPAMTLDPTFKTLLFWIVSRVNDCRYCMGHQERKLAVAGLNEDRIAALDSDWNQYSAAERAAFALARKLTYEPHTVKAGDIERLRKHYKDLQILEIVFTVANNNSTNRWTGGLNITQESDGSNFAKDGKDKPAVLRTFLTPTADAYKERLSSTLPGSAGWKRPALGTRAEAEEALAACRKRSPIIPLVKEEATRALLPADWSKESLPQWVRLLANFPKAGVGRIVSLRTAQEKGALSPRLKAQLAWIAARHDRAWYALGQAKRRLSAVGLSEDEIYRLDGSWEGYSLAERAAFNLARKLTVNPPSVVDADIAALRKHYSDKEVAELIYHVCNAAFFDRLTEACGLQLEER